jgi:hypothetical protein
MFVRDECVDKLSREHNSVMGFSYHFVSVRSYDFIYKAGRKSVS